MYFFYFSDIAGDESYLYFYYNLEGSRGYKAEDRIDYFEVNKSSASVHKDGHVPYVNKGARDVPRACGRKETVLFAFHIWRKVSGILRA